MNVYFFEHTRRGFYSAVFDAFPDKDAFLAGRDFQLGFGDREVPDATDSAKSERVKRKIALYDRHALTDIDAMLRSDGAQKEQTALGYIRSLMREKAPVREMFADPAVFDAGVLTRKVAWEIDKMYGFLRFMENENGVLYAPFEPDCDIVDLLAPHFIARFRAQQFILHDVRRKKAVLYNGKDCIAVPLDRADVYLSRDEKALQSLWKEYYASVNIPERANPRLMKGYMPVRYWKYLPEKS